MDNLGFLKIKNFCTSKDSIKKVKRQLTEWELQEAQICGICNTL